MSEPAANITSGEPEKKSFVRKPAEKSTATPLEHEERANKHLARRKHEKKEKPKRKLVKGLSRKEEKQLGQELMKQIMDNQYLLTSSYMKNGNINEFHIYTQNFFVLYPKNLCQYAHTVCFVLSLQKHRQLLGLVQQLLIRKIISELIF